MERPRTSVIIRWIVAAIIGVLGARSLLLAMTHESSMGGIFVKSLVGLSLLIAAALFIGPEIVQIVISPIHSAIDSILLPSETMRPPVDYKLARFYYDQMRFEEACEEYFKILEYHPQEVDAYLEGIGAATAADQPAMARKFYKLGMRKLSKKNGDRERLVQGVFGQPPPSVTEGEQVAGSSDLQAETHQIDGDGREQERHDF